MKGLFAIMDGKLGADKIRQEKWSCSNNPFGGMHFAPVATRCSMPFDEKSLHTELISV